MTQENPSNANPEIAHKKIRSMRSAFNGLLQEVKRISWTKKNELILSTKISIFSIFVFGLGIYIVDLGIKGILDLIGKLA